MNEGIESFVTLFFLLFLCARNPWNIPVSGFILYYNSLSCRNFVFFSLF